MHAGRALPAGVRLIAIAKERLGHETFIRDHWNSNGGMRSKWAELDDVPRDQSNPFEAPFPTPELFFDTWKGSPLPGRNPLFRVCNGASQKWTGVLSYLVGGEVAVNSARVDARGIRGNSKGEGTILGAVLVLDKDGEVLFHHKERTWGDHPSDAELLEAIGMLSPKSQAQRRSKI